MGIVPLDELYRFLWVPEPNSGLVIFMILAVFLQKSQKNNKNTKKTQKNEARQWGTGSRLAGWPAGGRPGDPWGANRGPWGALGTHGGPIGAPGGPWGPMGANRGPWGQKMQPEISKMARNSLRELQIG